jgi:hypothetical protein
MASTRPEKILAQKQFILPQPPQLEGETNLTTLWPHKKCHKVQGDRAWALRMARCGSQSGCAHVSLCVHCALTA